MSKLKVLIVDDSVVYRSQIKTMLEKVDWIEVVGTAANGSIALQKVQQMEVDLVTLDIEMPELDGLGFLKEAQKLNKNFKTIVFSSQNKTQAGMTITALELGASDFVAKPSGASTSLEEALAQVEKELLPKIQQFRGSRVVSSTSTAKASSAATVGSKPTEKRNFVKVNLDTIRPKVIVIASSTGGPRALETVFSGVKGPLSVPVLIVQHMPPVFTKSLAERLTSISQVTVEEAKHGDNFQAGKILLAPGDYHMRVKSPNTVSLDQAPKRNSVRPAADFLFETAIEHFGQSVLGIVLTGMGNDGCDGAVAIKEKCGGVFIQDKASCVVWGMPQAVYAKEAYDGMGTLQDCSSLLNQFQAITRLKVG